MVRFLTVGVVLGNAISVSGIAISIIFAFLRWAIPSLPKVTAWSGVVAGIVILLADIGIPQMKLNLPIIALFVVGALCIGGSIDLALKPETKSKSKDAPPAGVPQTVFEDFRAAYGQFKNMLGTVAPSDAFPEIRKNSRAYQEFHEDGQFLWAENVPNFYLVFHYPKKKLMEFPNSGWDPNDDGIWFDPIKIKARLTKAKISLRGSHQLPEGGAARLYEKSPSLWKELGPIRWTCSYLDGDVFSQQFEKGYLVGPFKTGNEGKRGRIFAIVRGSSDYDSYLGNTLHSECAPRGESWFNTD